MKNPKVLILAVIDASEQQTVNGLTRMQKLVILTQREIEGIDSQAYSFDPHEYGPFSKGLYRDLQALITNGYVEKTLMDTPGSTERHEYALTADGQELFDRYCRVLERPASRDEIRDIVSEYEGMPLLQLIKRVTHRYPETGVNCTIVD
jgi:uncharacterized protein YwgA